MEFFLTCDANWDARLDKIVSALNNNDIQDYFYLKNYGSSIQVLGIVLMCRESEYNFKQRIKFSKKERRLSLDIMLDLDQFRVIDQQAKEKIVAEKLLTELPLIISDYKFKDFDLRRFENDLKICMKKIRYID